VTDIHQTIIIQTRDRHSSKTIIIQTRDRHSSNNHHSNMWQTFTKQSSFKHVTDIHQIIIIQTRGRHSSKTIIIQTRDRHSSVTSITRELSCQWWNLTSHNRIARNLTKWPWTLRKMTLTTTYDLDMSTHPRCFSSLRNYQAENRYLQQFSTYRAEKHTDVSQTVQEW